MKKKSEKSTLSVTHDNNEIIDCLNENNISYKCYSNKDIAILNELGKCVARIFIQRKSMRVQTKTLNDFSKSLENVITGYKHSLSNVIFIDYDSNYLDTMIKVIE